MSERQPSPPTVTDAAASVSVAAEDGAVQETSAVGATTAPQAVAPATTPEPTAATPKAGIQPAAQTADQAPSAPRFVIPDFVAAAAAATPPTADAATNAAPQGAPEPPNMAQEAAPKTDAAGSGQAIATTPNAPLSDAPISDAAGSDPAGADDAFAAALAVPQWQPDAAAAEPTSPATEAAGTPPPPIDAPPPAQLSDDSGLPAPQEGEKNSAPEDTPMSLMDHLGELRVRLVRCCIAVGLGFLACWAVVDPIFNALVDPLLAVLPKGSHAIYTTLPEGFFTRMYIAFVAGVFVSSPVIFYQVWSFIAPGLYDEEKRYIIPVAVISALFFVCGGAFCYFMVFPYAFSFFVSFATEEIVAMPKVSDYLSFVLKLILAFGLIFEMPLFALFLARMGLITAAMMRKVRRYAILGIFIVAAILTPPDVVSQLLMACPMLILYEISIGVAALFGRDRNKKDKAEKPDAAAAKDTPKDDQPKPEEGPAAADKPAAGPTEDA